MSDLIPVQPREIVDLVYRVARVAGLDHGDADLVARFTSRREVDGQSCLDQAVDDAAALVDAARAADRVSAADPGTAAGYAEAARDGVMIERSRFARLYESAKSFLVAERILDEVG